MIEKIVKMISNLKILSKMNEIIGGLNTHTANKNNPHNVTAEQLGLATAYVYKGSVTNFSDLPTNAQNGWVYSVENEYIDSSGNVYPAGSNFAWNGSKWDDLGGSLSGYAKSVNSQTPDSKGNVFLNLVKSLEKNTEDKLIVHNADGTTQELELGKNYDNDLNNILDSITELETRVVPIEKGGTGATTAAAARANLGIEEIISSSQKKQYSTGWFSATTNTAYSFNIGLTSDKWYVKSFKAKLDDYELDMQTNQYGDSNQFNGAHCNFNGSTLIVTTDSTCLIHGIYLYNKRTRKNTFVKNIYTAQLLVVCEEI